MRQFRETLEKREDFVITCEHVPGRGLAGKRIDNIMKFAEEASASDLIHALSLTDNAGGNPAFSADILAFHIIAMGVDVIVHFSTKDMNRNAIEARAYALKKCDLSNLLVVSGDYPITGFLGKPKPVFDVDSVIALHYLKKISEGLEITEGSKKLRLDGTDFFLGAAASPFKWTEASSVMQYKKLEKKINAGADFIVTQLGYDSRKQIEFIQYVRNYLESDIPILGSVYVLSRGAARFMNRGEVPGAYVSNEQLAAIEAEAKSDDKGKAARLERASLQVAILKGLGYNGAHIEGLNLRFKDVSFILERSREVGENWRDYLGNFTYSPPNPFFLFTGGEKLGNGKPKEKLTFTKTRRRRIFSPRFWLMRLFHRLIFVENTLGYKVMRGLVRFAGSKKLLSAVFKSLEHTTKKMLFDCRKCDDCSLFELYYLCAESLCPKGMRIGPCGGSRTDGRCEVFEHRLCMWERVYWRAKNRKETEKLEFIVKPRDWELYETSSWENYYLKRDHSGTSLELTTKNRN
jgi:methylenetetrahydrofolate reductase (NADPH)